MHVGLGPMYDYICKVKLYLVRSIYLPSLNLKQPLTGWILPQGYSIRIEPLRSNLFAVFMQRFSDPYLA